MTRLTFARLRLPALLAAALLASYGSLSAQTTGQISGTVAQPDRIVKATVSAE